MPINDWQFWVVTAVAIGAIWMLKRALLPRKKGKKTALTVGGRPMGKKGSPGGKDCGC